MNRWTISKLALPCAVLALSSIVACSAPTTDDTAVDDQALSSGPEAPEAILVNEPEEGSTIEIEQGSRLIAMLASAAPWSISTPGVVGHSWEVQATDDAFGDPVDYTYAEGPNGSGTAILTWRTDGNAAVVGDHHVTLGYRAWRPWMGDGHIVKALSFTVRVKAPADPSFPPVHVNE
jgi:hypothetical protein